MKIMKTKELLTEREKLVAKESLLMMRSFRVGRTMLNSVNNEENYCNNSYNSRANENIDSWHNSNIISQIKMFIKWFVDKMNQNNWQKKEHSVSFSKVKCQDLTPFILLFFVFAATGFGEEINIRKKFKELSHRRSEVRIKAAKDLGKAILTEKKMSETEKKETINKFIDLLKTDENPSIKTKVAELLGNIGDKSAVFQLIETAKTDKSPDTRFSAVLSLGQIQDELAIPTLTEIFLNEKEDLGMRLQAGNALSYYAKKEVVDALTEGLKNDNSEIRLQSVCSLGNIIPDFMLDTRIKLLNQLRNDVDDRVKQYVEDTLKKLQPKKE